MADTELDVLKDIRRIQRKQLQLMRQWAEQYGITELPAEES